MLTNHPVVVVQLLYHIQLCDPMDCSAPGFPVLHYLLEFALTYPLSQWCHPTISSSGAPFSSCPQSFPASWSFPISQLFASGGQSIGASALASVLPMNIQGCFPLGLTGLISLQSKGLSRVFSSTMIWKHQLFNYSVLSLLYGLTLTSLHDYWKSHNYDYRPSSTKWCVCLLICCVDLS